MVTAGNVTSSRGIVTTTDFTGWVYQAIQTRKKKVYYSLMSVWLWNFKDGGS